LAGDFVLSTASILLARIGNEEVVKILSQVLEDLVAGESVWEYVKWLV
jgi:geranylgeranyl pyrophosphate synthase